MHGKFKDLTGQKFGMLTAIRWHGMERGKSYWICICDCNPLVEVKQRSDKIVGTKEPHCGCQTSNRLAVSTAARMREQHFEDLTGQKFERLTVVGPEKETGSPKWICQCDCGGSIVVAKWELKHGEYKSCGCLQREKAAAQAFAMGKANLKHGKTSSIDYNVWRSVRQRCFDKNSPSYFRYGAKGIKVCSRWLSFEAFHEDMGPRPSISYSIDRKDNQFGYSCGHCEECIANNWPSNCRWATAQEQQRNRTNNIYIAFDGRVKLLVEWAEEYGIPQSILHSRVFRLGWPFDVALQTKPNEPREDI